MQCASILIDITPKVPVKLCGYVNSLRTSSYAEQAHAPMYASVLFMKQDTHHKMWITLDVLSVKKELIQDMKTAIAEQYDIAEDDIIIQAIHTHSGPGGFSVDAMGKEYEKNEEYRTYVKERILSQLPVLFQKLQSCEIRCGMTTITGYYDNRNDAEAAFDSEAKVVKFIHNKELQAVIVNISVHSTVLGPKNMEISYDLLGSIREELYQTWHVYPIMMLGSAADVSNRHFRKGDDFAELSRVARGIAKQILSISDFQKYDTSIWKTNKVVYELAYDNRKYYSDYQAELKRIDDELANGCDATKEKLNLSSKDKLLSKLAMKDIHKQIVCETIDLGNLRILCFPGELTSVFGKILKQKNKNKFTLLATCANDHHGYFLEKELYGRCYESIATLIPKGTTEDIIHCWEVTL